MSRPARARPARAQVSPALVALGGAFLAMPPLLAWLLHGDHERYMWVISGPPPFDQLGSGPVQLWLSVGFWLLGLGCVTLGTLGRHGAVAPTGGHPSKAALAASLTGWLLVGLGALIVATLLAPV